MRLAASLLVVATLFLAACNSQPEADRYDQAIDQAAYDLEDTNFEDVGDTTQCTEDCSGHDAGFEWARENGLTDPSECGGQSASFIEGCEAYTTALQDEASEDDDADQ